MGLACLILPVLDRERLVCKGRGWQSQVGPETLRSRVPHSGEGGDVQAQTSGRLKCFLPAGPGFWGPQRLDPKARLDQ